MGALLALLTVTLGAQTSYRVQVAEPEVWHRLLSTLGIEATTERAPLRIAIGADRQLGVSESGEKVRVASVVDSHDPDLDIFWEEPAEVAVYSLPESARVFVRERHTAAPLMAGVGDTLWLAVPPGAAGYERFPYLLHALVDLGLEPPFRGDRLWAFFDSSYRLRADPGYLARQWREAGISGLHVAAWHYYDPDSEKAAYLDKLIAACRREGILVYAWLELPHVSENFWQEHAECREKTASLQDAKLDWRKLIDLTDVACAAAVETGVERLLTAFDWDGVNLGELYFESLHGPDNPARFTPMNETVRTEAKPLLGFDPLELCDAQGPHHWSKQPADWQAFVDYRAELALRLQQHWLGIIRATLPEANVVITQIDDQFDPRMRELLGADAATLLELDDPFTLLIEDPAPLWSLGPERYPEIARRYQPLTDSPERLAIDINIVERYQQTYPTRKQTGGELFQLVDRSSRSFARVALYFENSISPVDLALLPQASAGAKLLEASPSKVIAEAPQPFGVNWSGFAKVDGAVWPVADSITVWLPAGHHKVEPAAVHPPGRIVRFTGDLLSAQVVEQTVSLSYKYSARSIALLDRRPRQVTVDGALIEPDLVAAKRHWSLRLPRGSHTVTLSF
ncbi:MAG: hypothetical protein O3A53_12530 [Acidobacteria bacterium]|nr:hypothetical protein [Acidobacteriota bacterium]